jgi:hypothetical protein
MQIAIMNLKSFWERHRARRWTVTAAPSAQARAPRRFQPLTREESIVILEDSLRWLTEEAKAMLVMRDGASKERRRAELRARHESIARDCRRLSRAPEG